MLTLNDGRAELWQWDTGRTLAVDADCSQVHFSNKVFGRSIDVDVVGGVAIIPDVLLQTDKDLNVWAFVGTAENGYTKISKTFKVNRRSKPADYVFTPADQITLQTIKSQIGDLSDLTTEAKDTLVAAINEAARTGGGGGGSTVELDTTLTQSGQAADAKAVGDALAGKQNTISDLEAIRAGAAKGATALQSVPSTYRTASEQDTIDDGKVDKVTGKGLSSNDYTDAAKAKVDALAPVATSGSYNDLTNKPTIPAALPNPNALTFTGAVTGSYDGSAPLEVNIPSGGGSSSWETVIDTTLTEEAGIDTGEMPGKTEVMCLFAVPKHTGVISLTNNSRAFGASLSGFNMAGSTYGKVGCIYGVKINGHAVQFAGSADTSSAEPSIDTTTRTPIYMVLLKPNSAANDIPLKLAVSLPIGTKIKVFVR